MNQEVDFEINQANLETDVILEALNDVLAASEADFQGLKEKTWYKRLWGMMTFSKDNEKRLASGVANLAKLQDIVIKLVIQLSRNDVKIMQAVAVNQVQINELAGFVFQNTQEIQTLQYRLSLIEGLRYCRMEFLSIPYEHQHILASVVRKFILSSNIENSETQSYMEYLCGNANLHHLGGTEYNCLHIDGLSLKEQELLYHMLSEVATLLQEDVAAFDDIIGYINVSPKRREQIDAVVEETKRAEGLNYMTKPLMLYAPLAIDTDGVLFDEWEQDDEEIEAQDSSDKESWRVLKNSFTLFALGMGLLRVSMYDVFSDSNILDSTWQLIEGDELKQDVGNGMLSNSYMQQCMHFFREDDDDAFVTQGLKNPENNLYIAVFCEEGLFFPAAGTWGYVPYGTIWDVKQSSDGLEIALSEPYLFCGDTLEATQERTLRIEQPKEYQASVRLLRKCVESIMETYGNSKFTVEYEVKEIIENAISKIGKSSDGYVVDKIRFDDKVQKKLKNALAKYAVKVREDDAIAFIDTSLLGSGKEGLLFAKDGIAFVSIFEKVFLKYDEILTMSYNKKKSTLYFHGEFGERKNNNSMPNIDNIYYNLTALEECITKIQYLI